MLSYPDETRAEVRFPLTSEQEHGDRDAWPWLPAEIIQQCQGQPDEWQVIVLAPELETADGFPLCFRDASELRPTS